MLSALELLSLQLTHGLLADISQYWHFTEISHWKEKKIRAMEGKVYCIKQTNSSTQTLFDSNSDINNAPMATISILADKSNLCAVGHQLILLYYHPFMSIWGMKKGHGLELRE